MASRCLPLIAVLAREAAAMMMTRRTEVNSCPGLLQRLESRYTSSELFQTCEALLPETGACSQVLQRLDRRGHPWGQSERERACRVLTRSWVKRPQATVQSLLMTRAARRSSKLARTQAASEGGSALQEVELSLLDKTDYDKAPTEAPPPYDANVSGANNSDDEDFVQGQTFTERPPEGATTTSSTTTSAATSPGNETSSTQKGATTTAAPSSNATTTAAGTITSSAASSSTDTTTSAGTTKSSGGASTSASASTS